jgi:hypothetical protein
MTLRGKKIQVEIHLDSTTPFGIDPKEFDEIEIYMTISSHEIRTLFEETFDNKIGLEEQTRIPPQKEGDKKTFGTVSHALGILYYLLALAGLLLSRH